MASWADWAYWVALMHNAVGNIDGKSVWNYVSTGLSTASSIVTLLQALIALVQWCQYRSFQRKNAKKDKESGQGGGNLRGSRIGGGAVTIIVVMATLSAVVTIAIFTLPLPSTSALVSIASAQMMILGASSIVNVQSRSQRQFTADIHALPARLAEELNKQMQASQSRDDNSNAVNLGRTEERLNEITANLRDVNTGLDALARQVASQSDQRQELDGRLLGTLNNVERRIASLEDAVTALTESDYHDQGRTY